MKESVYDYIIIGAGIVGAAVAHRLSQRQPHASILIVEKESGPARHQTGRNSGVIHAGVYYPPGSLKARYCREGLERTMAFCRQFHLPFEQCGKLVVATNAVEQERLTELFERCQQNDLSPQRMSASEIRRAEPNISGVEAIEVRHTGITDYTAMTHCLLEQAGQHGRLSILYGVGVSQIEELSDSVRISLSQGGEHSCVRTAKLISCAGIYADSLIRAQGLECHFRMLPFKGEYYRLSDRFNGISQRLIYPVPDPAMPFLGVHLTKMIGGYTTVGPNAVLASGREAYDSLSLSIPEWWHSLSFTGLWRLLWQHRSAVGSELASSISKHVYARRVQKYCAAVTADDFSYYRPGIRAQAVSREGALIHDFLFVESEFCLHVANAPSPAATSALPIADAIADKVC